jgi:ribosomal protein S18 acetylase RimI-like enzyme
MAAEGFFRFMLGRRGVEILARAYREPDHDLSFQRVTFAERNGAVVGMVSGFTAEQHRRSSRRVLERAAGRWNLRLAIVSTVLRPLFRVIDSVADGDYYLQSIAVDPEGRGAGVGSALMDEIEARARAAGSRRLALDVAASNETARRLYERRGWTVESRWPKRLRLPGLTLLRMTRVLA